MDLEHINYVNYGAVTVRFEFNQSSDIVDPVLFFSKIQNILYDGIPKDLKISEFKLKDIREFLKIFDLSEIDLKARLRFKLCQSDHLILNSSFKKSDIHIDIHQWSADKKMILESFHIKNNNPAFTKMFFDILCFCRIQVIPYQNLAYAINENGVSLICQLFEDTLSIYVIYDQISISDFLTKNKYFRLNWQD